MSEMLERIIKAVRSYEVMRHNLEWRVVRLAGFGDIRFRSKDYDEAQARCDELNARAVIQAMREPTEAMWNATAKTLPKSSPLTTGDLYRAMIDAALSEGG